MIQKFFDLKIKTNGQKLYDFTNHIVKWISIDLELTI